jgi:Protein O-mannosyl-transferase TMEM260-like
MARRKSKQKRRRERSEGKAQIAPPSRRDRRPPKPSRAAPRDTALADRPPPSEHAPSPAPPAAGSARSRLVDLGLNLIRDGGPLSRADRAWAIGVGILSAALFATTLTGHTALGDAPESVAGVSSLGILHAPGYPAYVLAAWLFTKLIPFGSFAFQVNLFSLVCASGSVAGTYLLARRLEAARWASALGALALACGAAFWFYADFAKHDMFSGLALVVAVNLLLAWQASPSVGKLVGLGAAVGIGLGSSWPLAIMVLPAIALCFVLQRRLISLTGLAAVGLTALATTAALYGFVMIRAAQDPAVNWGDAETFGRLVSLINRADFKLEATQPRAGAGVQEPGEGSRAPEPLSPGLGALSPPRHSEIGGLAALGALQPLSRHTTRSMGVDLAVTYEELGLAGMVLAGVGLGFSLWRRRGPPAYVLLALFLTNLVGTALAVGAYSFDGVHTALTREGFLLGSLVVLAVWLALGATAVTVAAARAVSTRERSVEDRAIVGLFAVPVLCLAVLLPSLLEHGGAQARASAPYADRFAESVFEELPDNAVVFIFGAERTQPLIYRQVVDGDRPDVTVVAADAVGLDWYREELAARLGRPLPPSNGITIEAQAAQLIRFLSRTRPVYLDFRTAQQLRPVLASVPHGLLAQPRIASGSQGGVPLSRFEHRVRAAGAAAGFPDPEWQNWPNSYVLAIYTSAGLEVAREYFNRRDAAGLRRALRYVLRMDSDNTVALRDLYILDTQGLPG